MFIKQFWAQNHQYIKVALWLFAAGIIAGITAAFYYPQLMEEIIDSFMERFGDNPALDFSLVQQIFLQNLTASALAWVGGLLLGLAPIFALLFNGFVLGYISTFILLASTEKWYTLGFLAVGLLPHGVIEIPVFIMASVLGLRLGYEWVKPESQGQRLPIFRQSLKITAGYFVWVVLGLAAAAVIEVYVSGLLVNNFS